MIMEPLMMRGAQCPAVVDIPQFDALHGLVVMGDLVVLENLGKWLRKVVSFESASLLSTLNAFKPVSNEHIRSPLPMEEAIANAARDFRQTTLPIPVML